MERRLALERIYGLHGEFVAGLHVACGPACAACCTDQVTVTGLEARVLLEGLEKTGNAAALKALLAHEPSHRPNITLNGLARLCLEHKDPPEEDPPPAETCPLLTADGLCPVHEARPMACRALLARTRCREGGFADMDPYWLTVNEVFVMAVEHLDADGFSANLVDAAHKLAGKGRARGLLANEPIPGLMIPPEHQNRIRPLVRDLEILLMESTNNNL